jgi:hypothetical protein
VFRSMPAMPGGDGPGLTSPRHCGPCHACHVVPIRADCSPAPSSPADPRLACHAQPVRCPPIRAEPGHACHAKSGRTPQRHARTRPAPPRLPCPARPSTAAPGPSETRHSNPGLACRTMPRLAPPGQHTPCQPEPCQACHALPRLAATSLAAPERAKTRRAKPATPTRPRSPKRARTASARYPRGSRRAGAGALASPPAHQQSTTRPWTMKRRAPAPGRFDSCRAGRGESWPPWRRGFVRSWWTP